MSPDDAHVSTVTDDVRHIRAAAAVPSPRPWTSAYASGIRAIIPACTESLLAPLERSARKYSTRVALDFFGTTMTYTEVLDEVTRAARVLHDAGVRRGTRVALILPACPQHIVAFYAVLRAGGTVVEHNPAHDASQLTDRLVDSGCEVVVAWDRITPLIDSIRGRTAVTTVLRVDVTATLPDFDCLASQLSQPTAFALLDALRGHPVPGSLDWDALVAGAQPLSVLVPGPAVNDVAVLHYPDVTTDTPRGSILTHRNLGAGTSQVDEWLSRMTVGEEIACTALPLTHPLALILCVAYPVHKAARLVLVPTPDVHLLLATMRRVPATFFGATPLVLETLADAARTSNVPLTSIATTVTAGAELSGATATLWDEATGGVLVHAYGMAEASPLALFAPPAGGHSSGSLGVPVPSTDARIVRADDPSVIVSSGEEGELLVQGPQVFSGYWNRPEETTATLLDGGWLRTGDLVVQSTDGSVSLVVR